VGFAVGNAAGALLHGLTLSRFGNVPGDNLSRPYFRALNRLAAAFALLADSSMMLLGGELKRRERLSARLGDVLSHLYLGSAALKRYHDLGNPEPLQPLLRWALEENLGLAEQALDDLLGNFPNPLFGCLLRVLVFPLGRRHKGPDDELDAEVAAILGRPHGDLALESLLDGCYRPQGTNDPIAALQQAVDLLDGTAAVRQKLHTTLKAGLQLQPGEHEIEAALREQQLSAEEAEQLRQAEAARRRVIDVDDFAKDDIKLSDGKVR
jgi:acyl-CoA dehydrogenase